MSRKTKYAVSTRKRDKTSMRPYSKQSIPLAANSIGICVLFYEKPDQTAECIKSFLRSGVPIYILNNNSSSSSRNFLGRVCSNYSNIHIFDSPSNIGISAGRNLLIQKTHEPWLFFVDNDIRIATPNWLNILNKYIEAYPDIDVFVPKLYNLHERRYVPHLSMRIEMSHLKIQTAGNHSNMFPGGASIINRRLFEKIGLYDEEMKIGFEDWEFALRAILSGHPASTLSVDDILLIHEHRIAEDDKTLNAILTRYDKEVIGNSYRHIIEKYNIVWAHDFEPWLEEQLKMMTNSNQT